MPTMTKRRLWLNSFSSLVILALLCVGFYFLAVRAGLSNQTAALWAGATFALFVAALTYGTMRALRDPTWNPERAPRLPRPVIFWLATGIVLPMLVSLLHLGVSFLLVAVLTMIAAVGVEVSSRIVGLASWVGISMSLISGCALWWFLWKRCSI